MNIAKYKNHLLQTFAALLFTAYTAGLHAQDAPAGKVLMAVGSVSAKSGDNSGEENRDLKRRSKIFPGETILTGSDSQVQLRMSDGALISLGEKAEFVVKAYSYDQPDKEDAVVLSVLKGGLRTITGKVDKSSYKMETPVATLGIRGTIFDIHVSGDGTTTVILREGGVDVTGQLGETVLLQLAGLATVIEQNSNPSEPGSAPSAVEKYLQSVLPVPAGSIGLEQDGSGGSIITIDVPSEILTDPDLLEPPTVPSEVEPPPPEEQPPEMEMDPCYPFGC